MIIINYFFQKRAAFLEVRPQKFSRNVDIFGCLWLKLYDIAAT